MTETTIPSEWVLALGGGGITSQLFEGGEDKSGRTTTGATAAIMRDAASQLPPIGSAVSRAQVSGASDPAPLDRVSSGAQAVDLGRTALSEKEEPVVKRSEPFSMAALMESARRKAQEKKEEEAARERGEVFHRVSSNDAMDDNMRNYREQQKALQGKLKGLTSSLRKFDIRAAEAEIEHERVRMHAKATAAQMWRGLKGAGVPNRPCPFDVTPPDMIIKILSFLGGKHLFLAFCASKRFDCTDTEFWSELLLREHSEVFPPTHTARELKECYRNNETRWARLTATFGWLKSQGCPSDVHGTRSGPWSKVTLVAVLTDCVAFTDAGAADWRREKIGPYLRCITALLNSSHEGIKELASAALANVVSSSDGGRELLEKHAAVKSLQQMLYSNSLGMQKQSTRAMVNCWIDETVRVVAGCDASYLNAPFRHLSSAHSSSRNVEWMCVDFSPSGAMNPPYTITMSRRGTESEVGRLQGHGEDSMGLFRISEATLNRSLQWMSGTCLDDDDSDHIERPIDVIAQGSHTADALQHHGSAHRIITFPTAPTPCPPSASSPSSRSPKGGIVRDNSSTARSQQLSRTSEMLQAAGRSTPKELPQIMAKFRDQKDVSASRKIAFGEMVDRVAGFQYRYQNQLKAGKLLNVCAGTEYMELLKTYQNGHGDDHVRLLAFGRSWMYCN